MQGGHEKMDSSFTLEAKSQSFSCTHASRHILEASIIAEDSQLSNQKLFIAPILPTIIILSLVNNEQS